MHVYKSDVYLNVVGKVYADWCTGICRCTRESLYMNFILVPDYCPYRVLVVI
jgi:hypothetical protein